jgi:Tfp pilus assembly protein PilO
MAASDWSERTRMLVTIGVAAAVNLLLGGGFYWVNSDLVRLDGIHKKRLKEKADLTEYVKQQEDRKSELNDLNTRYATQQRKLPEQEQVPELVTKIAEIAQKTHCTKKSFIYSPSAAAPPGAGGASYAQDVWKTRWEGDFWSFCRLVNQIEEHFERFIAFENLQIQPRNQGVVTMESAEAQHEITVDLVTYRYIRPPGGP